MSPEVEAVRQLCATAEEQLKKKTEVRLLKLMACLAAMYLKQIKKAGYVLSANAPPFARELRLWWCSLIS